MNFNFAESISEPTLLYWAVTYGRDKIATETGFAPVLVLYSLGTDFFT